MTLEVKNMGLSVAGITDAPAAAPATVTSTPAAPTSTQTTTDTQVVTAADVGDASTLLSGTPAVTETAAPAAAPAVAAAPVEAPAPAPAPVVAAPVQAPVAAPAPAAAPTPAPVVNTPDAAAPSSGTVSADTSGAVGATPAADAATPADFLATVRDAADQKKLADLGIAGYPENLQAAILDILENGTPLAKSFIGETLDYCRTMGPKALIAEQQGKADQINMFRGLQNAINNGDDSFRKMFGIYLAIVNEEKTAGAYQLNLLFRFLPTINFSQDDRTAFQNLLFLFRNTSSVAARKDALRQIDLNKAISKGLVERGQTNLMKFYKI